MENKGGKNEVLPDVPEQAERALFGAVEKAPQGSETPQVETEQASEGAAAVSLPPEMLETTPEQSVVKNTMPVVERNAEQIPKTYLKIVEDAVEELKPHPRELQSKVIEFKEDYLDQTFGRKLGKTA